MAERRNCDIVLQGGVTSGVVYPGLIAKLAEQYDFQNIGGASVGAIAASVTAAAEYARRKGKPDAFSALNDIAKWLGEPSKRRKGSNLFGLFQPQPPMTGLFKFALAFLTVGKLRKAVAWLTLFWLEILIGITPGLVLGILAAHSFDHSLWCYVLIAALTLLVCVAGILVTATAGLLFRITRIPKNLYGLCTGNAEPSGKGPPALVPWLHEQINTIAGKPLDEPLTFGDLQKAGINLQMMTTCLTWQRPFTLPFTTHEFYFSPTEFRRYFPEEIVRWLKSHSPDSEPLSTPEHKDSRDPKGLPIAHDGLLRLPDQHDLPVVVAARLSLSFPILFCTVPLYAVDFTLREADPGEATSSEPGAAVPHGGPRRPERVWFTDGGICNNFPLHLFDAPLARWPIFGVDLTDFREDGRNNEFRTHVPTSNVGGIQPTWTRLSSGCFKGNSELVVAIVNSARNWVNSLQAAAPGYRDRIVHIALKKEEGGLNLIMPPDLVRTLNEYGSQAGDLLIEHFIKGTDHGKPTPMTWDNQRWVRFRSTMAQLENLPQEALLLPPPPRTRRLHLLPTPPARTQRPTLRIPPRPRPHRRRPRRNTGRGRPRRAHEQDRPPRQPNHPQLLRNNKRQTLPPKAPARPRHPPTLLSSTQ